MEKWQEARLKAALTYLERGISIIPIQIGDKVPALKEWARYQSERMAEADIEHYWGHRVPGANIALICGEISNLLVLDFDTYKDRRTYDHFLKLFGKDIDKWCVVKTPRGGFHVYFQHREGLSNLRGNEAVDIKTNGGYVLAPPSSTDAGKYTWHTRNLIAEMPDAVFDFVTDLFKSNTKATSLSRPRTLPEVTKIKEGARNESMWSLAWRLCVGDTHNAEIQYYLQLINSFAVERPLSNTEIIRIIESASQRKDDGNIKGTSISEQVGNWVREQKGTFGVTELYGECGLTLPSTKKAARQALQRLLDRGDLEKLDARGMYRVKDTDLVKIDFLNAPQKPLSIWLPFDIHKKVDIMPKNIICVAGSPNVGKTALLLNILRYNFNLPNWRDKVYYFSSEMGGMELNARLSLFDGIRLEDWKFHPYERTHNFHDVIEPDGLNIVDFLEISDSFYKVSQRLLEIHDALKDGIAIVALQKKKGQEMGRGAEFSLEKPRLYLSVDRNEDDTMARGSKLTIVKAKNYGGRPNPNGSSIDFYIHGGWKLDPITDWRERE